MCIRDSKDAAREARRLGDLTEKVAYFPYPKSLKLYEQVEEELLRGESANNPGAVLASMLLPATGQVRAAVVRVDRDICALRVIEAIRMHAAETKSLPEKLDDISRVPIPDNPATGEPFPYRVEDGAAILDLLPKSGGLQSKRFIIRLR